MPIVTIYKIDGEKERRPIGYGGELCQQATAPYEKYDVPGSVTKTPTAEAFLPAEQAATTERLHQGG